MEWKLRSEGGADGSWGVKGEDGRERCGREMQGWVDTGVIEDIVEGGWVAQQRMGVCGRNKVAGGVEGENSGVVCTGYLSGVRDE